MRPDTLAGWLAAIVAAQPQRPALIEDEAVWTYARLWSRSGEVARAVSALPGFAPDTRVALVGANEPEYLAAYFGVLRAGGIVVPLNTMLDDAELSGQVGFVRALGTIAGDVPEETVEALREAAPVWRFDDLRSAGSGRLPELTAATAACILLTSGSTGRPKGVLHTHGTMLHAALQLALSFPFAADERSLAFLPFFASIPEHVLPTLVSGGAVDIIRRFDVERITRACRDATSFDAVPTIIARLLDSGSSDDLRRLRWAMFASEPMPVPLLERWWGELPGVELCEFYGMTELLTISGAPHRLLRSAPDSVGRPFASSAVTVADPQGDPVPCGVPGEVVCRSPARMWGYVDDPAATASALDREGGMRTGDVGVLDETGLLRLTGRLKDLIISGGLNIAPAEIEAVVCRHPQISAAAVVGIPDVRWGETPVVVAVPAAGHSISARDVLEFCRRELTGYKRPSGAGLVDTLPQTGIGKSAKAEIRQRVLSGEIELVRAG